MFFVFCTHRSLFKSIYLVLCAGASDAQHAGASDAQHADELQQQLHDQVAHLTAANQLLEAERDTAQHAVPAVPNMAPPGDNLSHPTTHLAAADTGSWSYMLLHIPSAHSICTFLLHIQESARHPVHVQSFSLMFNSDLRPHTACIMDVCGSVCELVPAVEL